MSQICRHSHSAALQRALFQLFKLDIRKSMELSERRRSSRDSTEKISEAPISEAEIIEKPEETLSVSKDKAISVTEPLNFSPSFLSSPSNAETLDKVTSCLSRIQSLSLQASEEEKAYIAQYLIDK